MTEYIDKQALLKKYCKEQHKGDCKHCDWYGDTWCRGKLYGVQIAEFPAADVVPVRHGRWILTKEFNDVIDMEVVKYTCSVCSEYRLSATGLSQATQFCPNCGAKMNGGKECD